MFHSVADAPPAVDVVAWCSLVTVVAAVASPFALIGTGLATARDVGLFQRVSFGLLNSWILVFAAVEHGQARILSAAVKT